jgi:hypothetical protein
MGWSNEPFDEEALDTEEAERRITQFVTSAKELPGPPVEELDATSRRTVASNPN